jgi:hypothetical protein
LLRTLEIGGPALKPESSGALAFLMTSVESTTQSVKKAIQALREAGHDVVAIAEIEPGATDDQVLERTLKEKRVLNTGDRDFGELVYARVVHQPG